MTQKNIRSRVVFSPEQCRAARGLLKWSQDDLAKAATCSRPLVSKYEDGQSVSDVYVLAISTSLSEAGVTVVEENGGGAGVRWRNPRK